MVNTNLFQTQAGQYIRPPDTTNLAGGSAYKLTDKQALAQYVMTGCLNATFYASAEGQLMNILETCAKVEPEFIAKLAVVAREKGYMKDTPALLLAYLSKDIGKEFVPRIFHRVIDNGKMLRNYVQIMRSGQVGRKSLGSLPRRLVREYFYRKSPTALLKDSIGNTPSLADIIKMVHPKPGNASMAAFYRYLIGKEVENQDELPDAVKNLIAFRKGEKADLTAIDFRLLTEKGLTVDQWKELLPTMGWHALRMNLNALNKSGVLADRSTQELVANRLIDREAIKRSRVFPYQLFTAYLHTSDAPAPIREALQDAMEIATENVPTFGDATVIICQDVSGSMQSPVTGNRGSVSSKVSCVHVGALITSCLLRVNKYARVFPFDTAIRNVEINPRDTVMTNAKKLSISGGGTDCSLPMRLLASSTGTMPKKVVVVYVSDNESWAHKDSTMMHEWAKFRSRVDAKLICIDLAANRTTQAYSSKDVLNVGGFSDQVFTVMESFVNDSLSGDHWVAEIEKTEI